jgi:hypothetical protein
MKTSIPFALLAASALQLQGCGPAAARQPAPPTDAELLHSAVQHLTDVIVYDIFSPPQASRAYAYASVAGYEALRPGYPGFRTLAGQLNGLTPVPAPQPGVQYSLPLAGVHAFMTVGRGLTFSRARMDSLRTAMDEQFRHRGIPGAVYDSSIAYGDRVAAHVLAWAAKDQFVQTRGYPKYTVTSEPGRWVPTPPAYMDAVEPNRGKLRPFVLDSGSQFRPEPPFAAAVVLTDEFGPNFAFVDSTEAAYGLPARSFRSFEQAAAEAAISRLYGGIHYRRSIEQGAIQGRKVGQLVVQRVHTREEAAPRVVARGPAPGATGAAGSATH